jgi:hypothetical protein
MPLFSYFLVVGSVLAVLLFYANAVMVPRGHFPSAHNGLDFRNRTQSRRRHRICNPPLALSRHFRANALA